VIGARGALAFWLTGALVAHAEPRIHWVTAHGRVKVEVSGLDERVLDGARGWSAEKLRRLLSVRVRQDAVPSMLGTWQIDGDVLRFTPQFPLTPGVGYRAEFAPSLLSDGGAENVTSDHVVPMAQARPGTTVIQIYPSGEDVPENLLKFYVHFSASMSRGNIYDHIHLRDEAGKEVELPFLEIDEELWDPDMKRLTLFIDPGRIKREVRPLEEVGPALQAGHRFTLAIDASWLDAAGQPLASKHERTYRVGSADRKPILPSEWTVKPPGAKSSTPLQVTFPESMDHALALRLLEVQKANGKVVEGTSALADTEKLWSFTPAEPWVKGKYEIIVPSILEDLAGNNVGKAFEVELIERRERVQQSRAARVSFEVK